MAQQTINLGTVANDGTGDTLRVGGDKINDNFTELYAGLVGLLDFKGATDCSANPNYPAASKGDFYLVSVAGKIGGASGTVVEQGDSYFATADNAGGTQASVGTSWAVVQGNITGAASVSDAAYGVGWDGDTTTAPSKNAVYDKIEAVVAGVPGTYTDEMARDAIGAALVAGTNTTVTVNDGADTITIASAPAWALAGTGQTATGVYDFAVDGAKANIDFAGLTSFNELLVIARGLTDGTTGVREIRVSVDNGSTFYAASGDYKQISSAGVETNVDALAFHTTNSTAARSLSAHIINTKGTAKYCAYSSGSLYGLFDASASDINAIRVTNSGGGNITGGTVRVYAR